MEWLRGVLRATSPLGTVLAFPLRLVWSLISSLIAFILTLLAPAIYILSYSAHWLMTLIHFCMRPIQVSLRFLPSILVIFNA